MQKSFFQRSSFTSPKNLRLLNRNDAKQPFLKFWMQIIKKIAKFRPFDDIYTFNEKVFFSVKTFESIFSEHSLQYMLKVFCRLPTWRKAARKLGNILLGTRRCVIPIVRQNQKRVFFTFLYNYRLDFYINVSIENYELLQGFQKDFFKFRSSQKNLICQKCQKIQHTLSFLDFQRHLFSQLPDRFLSKCVDR